MCKRLRKDCDEHGNQTEKWVRGPKTLAKVFEQPPGSKLPLFWNGRTQPVGPEEHPSLYSETIGFLLTRERRFVWTKTWAEQEERPKEWLWTTLKDYWEVDNDKKDFTLGKISRVEFRNKKSKWKSSSYTPYGTYEERLSKKPEQLSQSEWIALIRHWDTPEQQAIAERNSKNRAKHIAKHTTGRIRFPQSREKMTVEEDGAPSQGEFFKETHISPRTHGPIDELSREYIMNDQVGRDENGAQQPVTDEIYWPVAPTERDGRVQLMGLGVTPTDFFGPQATSSTSTHIDGENRIQELQLQMAEMKRISEENEAKRIREIEEIKRQALEKEIEAQRKIDDMQKQFQSHYDEMEARLMQKMLDMNATHQRGVRNGRRG
ncbi:hypothetical protein ACHQM5_003624 [Ranunculus cassubicifolius]